MIIGKAMQISDTLHGTIQLSEIEKQIISTPIFNRLHNISQNSTVYLTFPSNRTKRFEHSLGAMELCGKIFYYAVCNADKKVISDLFSQMEGIVNNKIDRILKDEPDKYRLAIGDENQDPKKIKDYKKILFGGSFYNNLMPLNLSDDEKFLFLITVQAIRISALLHDVGHPPFSHITESALKNVWKETLKTDISLRTERQKLFIESMEKYFNSQNADLHEQIGNIISEKLFTEIIGSFGNGKAKNTEAYEMQLFKIFIKEFTCAILQEKVDLFEDIHRIIDGALDGDRLDYVSRDPKNSGLNMGVIEYDRLISSMILTKNDKGRFLFCANTKTLNTVEDFFDRRWKMYKHIIWHHRVIKTDYLLQNCIEELSLRYLEKEDNDSFESNSILPYDISGLWKALWNNPSNKGHFYTLIQWDDSWLMTILKKHYFGEYANITDTIGYQLEELLANKRHYYSVVKKAEDFSSIDSSAAKILSQGMKEIYQTVDKLDKSENSQPESDLAPVDPFLNKLKLLKERVDTYLKSGSTVDIDGFILASIKYDIPFFPDGYLDDILTKAIRTMIKENFSNKISDSLIVFKNVKTGVKETFSLCSRVKNKDDIKQFNQLSKVAKIITQDRSFLPVFYVYVLKSDEYIEFETLKEEIGKCVGNTIVQFFKDELSNLIKV